MQMKDIINRSADGRMGEILRFAIVGIVATAIQYAIYLLLNMWMHPALSNTIGYLVSFAFNYVASTRYTFRVESNARRGAGFALSHVVNYSLQTILLSLFLWLGMAKWMAILPVFCICVPVNFILVRFFLKNDKLQNMRNPFNILKVKREERWLMLAILLILVALNALVIIHYYEMFTPLKTYYWPLFIRNFHVSGFDPITYSVVSDWIAGYNVYRHPLLAFYMYVPYLINQALMQITGHNCAIFIVATMQITCGFYAMLFFYRIVREIIELSHRMSVVLTLFYFSFAYVMLSTMVPDHFIISMMLLLIALYISGKRIKSGKEFTIWQTVLYFLLTAGTSLNNGLKIFLAGLFVNRRRFFRPRYLLLAVILPSALIWGFARWEYATLVWPRETAQHEAKKKKQEQQKQRAHEAFLAELRRDSIDTANGDTAAVNARKAQKEAKAAEARKKAETKKAPSQGKPISKGEFLRWTDITTSRSQSVVENLFGESIQLHPDNLLGDTLRQRPVIVNYRWWWNYAVEAIIIVLFIVGLWLGRRSRFLWLVMSFFLMDMALHIGLGFGINEVYIMSAHWIYAIPIAIAYILKSRAARSISFLLMAITAYLLIYNIELFVEYFLILP